MGMIVDRVAQRVLAAPDLKDLLEKFEGGHDVSLALAQSARSLLVASLWSVNPRPCLVIVSGEEYADRFARSLGAWLGPKNVLRYPVRKDLPWSDEPADDAIIGARTRAISALACAEAKIVVSAAPALMRCVPPKGSGYFAPSSLSVGDEVPFDEIAPLLVGMGYSSTEEVTAPGEFHIHGDMVDVFPAQATSPVRIEFFGDEIDRIRKMILSTGQTIGALDEIEIVPARELAYTQATIINAETNLWETAQDDMSVAVDLELIQNHATDPALDRYLVALYNSSATPLAHISDETLVITDEPRALFDDCQRVYDELQAKAQTAKQKLEGLYVEPRNLDFGAQQRLSLSSIMRAGDYSDASLEVRQPAIAGNDTKLINRVRQLVTDNYTVVFAVPDRSARESLKLRFIDEHIPIEERLTSDSADQAPLTRGVVSFIDLPIPAGTIIPAARLAVLSISDLTQRMARQRTRRRIDPTAVTFPFKPGDYVVHATHGIALFSEIVRQEVDQRERDYFLLSYAGGDKLYVPLEQVDRLTRYVGPDGSSPRLTRLNTADWSRVSARARSSAKKLAFDLVDLYTRRSTAQGHAFPADTPAQAEVEAGFPYELTPDQISALADIKTDMETSRPMDRLLCGDVGFGKTEVALRAAFKCVTDSKQVMILCPTTILAEQHFQSFYERLSPFEVNIKVLSRFVTPARQRAALEGFADGSVDILIGTHRLLSADVNPHNLGLVIIDEEQRFGVGHKEQLKNMREQVDVLTLSATPIPRTMQMAVSGVRDMSLILTPPPGRLPVKVHVGEYDSDIVMDAIRAEIERGGQVYYVSNRVRTIDEAVDRVREVAPEARIGVAHGQMSARETEDVMMSFQEHEIDVLVATTIIENGIDNPTTNTLIIEDSQRLGLAQLYQLKGRVGRGHTQAYAYFLFPGEFPLTSEAIDRLTAIGEYQDLGSGMRIAMRDLEIRGAGSLMGAEQHGNLSGVGFDLFTQMLGAAVAEARGETPDPEPVDVTINLPADFYLPEEYLPEVDKRVLAYRRLAAATELEDVDSLEMSCEEEFGVLPLAGRNLFDRARLRIRAGRLGIASVALVAGKIVFQGADVSGEHAQKLKTKGAIIYVKSKKMSYPYKKDQEDVVAVALGVLEELGGDDESEQ